MGKISSYRESLLEALSDPEEAAAYLNAGLEDSLPAFLKALKNLTQAPDDEGGEGLRGAAGDALSLALGTRESDAADAGLSAGGDGDEDEGGGWGC